MRSGVFRMCSGRSAFSVSPDPRRAMSAYRVFCESPMRVNPQDLQAILDDMLAP